MSSLLNRVLMGVLVAVCTGCGETPTAPSQPPSTGAPVPPSPPSPILAGEYRITFAAQDCESTFPAELRIRTYSSRLDLKEKEAELVVTDWFDVFSSGVPPTLRGVIQSPSQLTLSGYYGSDQWDTIPELLTSGNLLSILVDGMTVTSSPQGLAGTFAGSFTLYDRSGESWPTIGRCFSQRHGVALARQGP